MLPVSDDIAYTISAVTRDQIRDLTDLPGQVRALLYFRRSQSQLKMRFHLGASHGIQDGIRQGWKHSGDLALRYAAAELRLDLDASKSDVLQWNALSDHDKETSGSLLNWRASLRQRYFTQMLSSLVEEHREKLAAGLHPEKSDGVLRERPEMKYAFIQ